MTGAMAEGDKVCGREGRNKGAGAGAGTEGDVQRCRCQGGHGQDRGVAWRRTRTGQECRREGGHGQDRSVGAVADTDRTEVSARGRTRTGQECRRGGGHGQHRTDDNITVSKHKLIHEEKRERKQKRPGHATIYRTRLGRQDYPTTKIQQESYALD